MTTSTMYNYKYMRGVSSLIILNDNFCARNGLVRAFICLIIRYVTHIRESSVSYIIYDKAPTKSPQIVRIRTNILVYCRFVYH